VALPTYPWQREHFWYDNIPGFGDDAGDGARGGKRADPLLGWEVALAGANGRRVWENSLNSRDLPLLFQHRVHNTLLLPASTLLGMAAAGGRMVLGDVELAIADVVFHRPIVLDEQSAVLVQTVLAPKGDGYHLEIFSRTPAVEPAANSQFVLHVSCSLAACQPKASGAKGMPSAGATGDSPIRRDVLASRLTEEMAGIDYYAALAASGISFGEVRPLHHVWRSAGEAMAEGLGQFQLDQAGGHAAQVAPSALDAAFQLTPLAAPQLGAAENAAENAVYTPARLAELRVAGGERLPALGHVTAQISAGKLTQRLTVVDAEGAVLAELRGLELLPLGQANRRFGRPARPEEWLYTLAWEPQALPDKPERQVTGASEGAGKWLVFADRSGVAAALAAALRRAGHAVVLVHAGERLAALQIDNSSGPEEYWLNPTSAQEMESLWQELFPHAQPQCRGIVHLWALDGAAHETCLASALHVCQAAARSRWTETPKVWIVTRGAQRVVAAPQCASLWGLGRVLGVEHPDIWGGLVDLDPALPATAAAELLLAEVTAGAGENEVALDASGRYAARLVPAGKRAARDDEPVAPDAVQTTRRFTWRTGAAYLITGGLGGLGLLVAQWMVEQGARRLILMGRTPLPPRAEWAGIDPDSPSGRRIAAVRNLEAQGAAVHLASVDVGDEAQLAAFLAQYESEAWPPIRGVVHAAGTVRDRLLAQLTWAEMAEVLHAKVTGGWLLHKLLPDVDFLVFFSSIGALLGQPGQANYAAANAFLDALAHRLRKGQALSQQPALPGQRTVLSINWGPWAGVGFAELAGGQRVTQQLAQQGIAALEAAQGLDILRRLLVDTAPMDAQVAVLPLAQPSPGAPPAPRLLRQLQAAEAQRSALQFGDSAGAAAGQSETRNGAAAQASEAAQESVREMLLALEPAQRRARLVGYLQGAVAQVLRMPQARVGLTTPLGALGLDSLMALELRNRLESALAITLPATFAWNYPTIQDLAPYVAGRMDVALGATAAAPAGREAAEDTPGTEPEVGPGHMGDALGALDQLLAGIDALSDESALDLLKTRPK
jgi:NAD(P)-dependent dehydrogenase (short-subunit alcohol dehydrogenase family)/acyl carrier protein